MAVKSLKESWAAEIFSYSGKARSLRFDMSPATRLPASTKRPSKRPTATMKLTRRRPNLKEREKRDIVLSL
jgi:hypothetical protein